MLLFMMTNFNEKSINCFGLLQLNRNYIITVSTRRAAFTGQLCSSPRNSFKRYLYINIHCAQDKESQYVF
nr:unnamed protein product [Callosobruchus analis]